MKVFFERAFLFRKGPTKIANIPTFASQLFFFVAPFFSGIRQGERYHFAIHIFMCVQGKVCYIFGHSIC